MGTDLVLQKDDMVIELGRSYHYKIHNELPQSHEEIDDSLIILMADAMKEMAILVSYVPKDVKDMIEGVEKMRDYFNDTFESLIRHGRASVIVELREEGFSVTEVA